MNQELRDKIDATLQEHLGDLDIELNYLVNSLYQLVVESQKISEGKLGDIHLILVRLKDNQYYQPALDTFGDEVRPFAETTSWGGELHKMAEVDLAMKDIATVLQSQLSSIGGKSEWGTPGNTAIEDMPAVITPAEVARFRDYEDR